MITTTGSNDQIRNVETEEGQTVEVLEGLESQMIGAVYVINDGTSCGVLFLLYNRNLPTDS